MIRALLYSVLSLALAALTWALASTVLSATGGSLGASWAASPVAVGLAGLVLAAALCPVAGSRRGVPALAPLALPVAAMALAALGRLGRTGALAEEVARASGEADAVAVLAATAASDAAATAAAFLAAGLSFLGASLVGASAREDAYEPASPDPLRWVWLGAGVAGAGCLAAMVALSGGGLGSPGSIEDLAVQALLGALLAGPLLLLPVGRKVHDLSPAPARRLAAARAAAGLGLLGAAACFGLAGRWQPAAAVLARVGAAPPAERAGALGGVPELVERYEAAGAIGLVGVLAAAALGALVLSRALRRPLCWVPGLVVLAGAVASTLAIGLSSRARVEALGAPPCAHDCLPADLVLALRAGAPVPHMAPSDRCDPPPGSLPRVDSETLRPPRLEVGRCLEGPAVLVVVSSEEVRVAGATAVALEAGRLPDEAAAVSALRVALEAARRSAPPDAPCRLLVHGDLDAGVVDAVSTAVAMAGFTDGRALVAHPGRERPVAWRELPWPLLRRVEGGGWSSPARAVEGACAGSYRLLGGELLDVAGATPCGEGVRPAAEPWGLTFGEGELALEGPWGEVARAATAAGLADGARELLAGRLGMSRVRGLLLDRGGGISFARDLEARTALVVGPGAPFAASTPRRGRAGGDRQGPAATAFRVAFGGVGEDEASGLALAADGGILVAGGFGLYADLDPGPGVDETRGRGSTNHFVMRLDPGGEREWVAPFRGLRGGRGGALDALADGGVVLAGDFWGALDLDPGPAVLERSAEGERTAALIRLDGAGRLLWAHAIARIGGRVDGRGVAIAEDGAVLMTGAFAGTIDFDPGPGEAVHEGSGDGDVFVSRFDRDGAHLWTRSLGGPAADWAADVAAGPSGLAVLVGQVRGSVDLDPGPGVDAVALAPFGDGLVLALDRDGGREWARVFASRGVGGSVSPTSVALSPLDGAVVVGGSFNGVVDFDPSEGVDEQRSAPGRGDTAFVACLDAEGDHLWARAFGGALGARVEAVSVGADGEVLAAGRFAEVADFDPGEGVDERRVVGDTDLFVTAFGPRGEYRGTLAMGGPRVDGAAAAVRAPDGSVVVAGRFGRAVDLDPGEGVDERSSAGETDAFVIRLPRGAIRRAP